jgi:polar amino acid transport system substrate-binding protein
VIGRLVALVLCLLPLLAATIAGARADPLDAIQQRGELAVGVKTDYPPFGQLNAAGAIVGFEPDLAADLARRAGVKLRLVAVTSANRLQRLEDGTVDVLIATLGDTQERRAIATLIEPDYYASGINILLPEHERIRDWADLRGQPVCATQGQYANRLMAERYLLDLRVFNTNRDAELALEKGSCVGWMQDDTLITGELAGADWAGYHMPLQSVLPLPWAIAISRAGRGSRLERLISDAVADWHRSGLLIRTEQAHRIPPSAFLQRTHALWNQMASKGALLCRRLANGAWPEKCRNQALISATEASGIRRVGLLVKERLGLDFSFVYDRYDRAMFLTGLLRTLALSVGCVLGAVAVGAIGALAICLRMPALSACVRGLLTFFRMTPPLLQIYVVFFGLGGYLNARLGLAPGATLVVVACLSFYAGAANAFALVEATEVLRVADQVFVFRLVTLPRALRLAQAAVVGSLVNVVKAAGMASAIAVPEIISASTSIIAERGNAGVMMNVLMVLYFLLVLAFVRLFGAVQRRLPGA